MIDLLATIESRLAVSFLWNKFGSRQHCTENIWFLRLNHLTTSALIEKFPGWGGVFERPAGLLDDDDHHHHRHHKANLNTLPLTCTRKDILAVCHQPRPEYVTLTAKSTNTSTKGREISHSWLIMERIQSSVATTWSLRRNLTNWHSEQGPCQRGHFLEDPVIHTMCSHMNKPREGGAGEEGQRVGSGCRERWKFMLQRWRSRQIH